MSERHDFEVFGRHLCVERHGHGWRVCHVGAEGKRRPAPDLHVPGQLAAQALAAYLADLCHEWAAPGRQDVRALARTARCLVFVYGTLRQGCPNHHLLRGRRLPGLFVTEQPWGLYLCGPRCSPCLLLDGAAARPVRGEVVEVDSAALAALDELERVNAEDGYRRLEIRVRPVAEGGETRLDVQAYVKTLRHAATPMEGPLEEYLPQHAARYRPRTG